MVELQGGCALVTGASQGIGLAIASALADAGMDVWMVARREDVLEQAAAHVGPRARPLVCDLTDPLARTALVDALTFDAKRLDVLVLNAGVIHLGHTVDAALDDFSEQFESNVLAPYALTQACLPLLFEARGQIVFVNSTAGKSASPGVGQFSATQHAMRAFADTLRQEVNDRGVRVTVVHPGRTATPRQASIHEFEGRDYNPEQLMQPKDVADAVLAVVTLPGTAEITEVVMRPMRKS
jgi:NADP-dependent 3-hydroxy acid dehydrogenase YdfG